MSNEMIGTMGIGFMLILFFLGVPVAFAMGIAGVVGFAVVNGVDPALNLLTQDLYEGLSSYPLSVIPMFVLMGGYAFAAGIGGKLYETAYVWMGRFRGGLCMATTIACAFFGAVCGSTAATSATIGKIALPEMKKYNYDDQLATGTLAAGGVLGILIPPSTVFIVYGILVEESIGKLFIAGIGPGILLTILYCLVVFVLCRRNPEFGPAGSPSTWKEKIKSLVNFTDAIILFAIALGGLFAGIFTPTQSGAIGAAGALVIGLIRRNITWKKFIATTGDSLVTACMILFIIACAVVFGHFMAVTGIPTALSSWVGGLPIPRWAVMGIIIFIFFIGGMLMDAMALIVVGIPIFFPLVRSLGYDPIWFGAMVVLICGMGVISPPVGVNCFVIKGIAPDVPIAKIFKGIMPFLAAIIVAAIIIMIFPPIVTWLPSLISY